MTLLDDIIPPRPAPNYSAITKTWSDERVAALSKQWLAGVPVTQIGINLGVTRNSVVSKAHRIGLPNRPSPIKRRVVENNEGVPVVIPIEHPLATIDPQCRYYNGEKRKGGKWSDIRCTSTRLEGYSWCHEHCTVVFRGFGTEDSAVAA